MKLNNKSAATLAVACGLSLMVTLPETAMAHEDANTTESNTPANAEVVDTVSPLDEAQVNLDVANKVVEEKQREVSKAQDLIDNHGTSAAIQKDLDTANAKVKEANTELEGAQSDLKAKEDSLADQNKQKVETEGTIDTLNGEIEKTTQDKTNAQSSKDDEIAEAQEKSDKLAKEVAFQESRVKRAQTSLDIAKGLLQDEAAKKEAALAERAKLIDLGDIEELDAQLAALDKNIEKYQEEVESAQDDYAKKTERLNEVTQKRDQAQAALNALEEKKRNLKDMDLIVVHEQQFKSEALKDAALADNLKITFYKNGVPKVAVRMVNGMTQRDQINFDVNKRNGAIWFQLGTGKQYNGDRVEITCDGYKPMAFELTHLGGYRYTFYEADAPEPMKDEIDAAKAELAKQENDLEFAQGKADRSKNFLDTTVTTLENEQARKTPLEEKKAALEKIDATIKKLNTYIHEREEVVEQSEADLANRTERAESVKAQKEAADAELKKLLEDKDAEQAGFDQPLATLYLNLTDAQAKLDEIVQNIASLEGQVKEAKANVAKAQAMVLANTATRDELETKLETAKQLEAKLAAAKADIVLATKERDKAAIAVEVAKAAAANKPGAETDTPSIYNPATEIVIPSEKNPATEISAPADANGKPGAKAKTTPATTAKSAAPASRTQAKSAEARSETPKTSDMSLLPQISACISLGLASLGLGKKREN